LQFRLTRKAEEDVIGLYVEGARMFGEAQAERYHRQLGNVFDLIGRNPQIARERREIIPPVRVHPHKAHLIVYVVGDDGVAVILRVRHGREDWERDAVG
jgi:toxin ParE1/3/4